MDNLALQLRAAAERDDALPAALDQEFADLNGSSRDTQDVLDALWWAAHPLRPTPIGRTDPAVYLVELQAAVFSRAAVPEPQVERIEAGLIVRATASEHRLRQLTLNLAARAAAVDHLVTRFGRGLAQSTDAAVPVDEDLAAGVSLPSPPAPTDSSAAAGIHSSRPTSRVRWHTIVLAVGITVGVLGTLGAQALQHSFTATFANAAVAPAPTSGQSSPAPLPDAAAIRAVTAIFDQPADPLAGELADLGPAYNTVRVAGLPQRGTYGIYLAQRGTRQYCLVIQHVDLTASSICAGVNVIAQEGLRLNTVVLGALGVDETGPPVLLDLTATWLTDGTVMSSTMPHVPPGSAYAMP
jgi:hypothetical protein